MPELPEVETIKIGLENRIIGLEIEDVLLREPKLFKGDKGDVAGRTIKEIIRKAKVLIIKLNGGQNIAIHLKMTGQLVFQGADEKIKVVGGHPQREYNQPLPHRHTHIILAFTDGSKLYFNDLRKFGWMAVLNDRELTKQTFIKNIGPDPLSSDYSLDWLLGALMKKSNVQIKPLLMDQTFIAGIGNIYSDEILYAAAILPDRRVGTLTGGEIDRLYRTIPAILQIALRAGGTSDSTFIGVDGERGDYLKQAFVYHKELDPKGHKVERKKIGGRTAHFCSFCQQ
jgi:formamidopyrimidine-DNA glycosylase